MPLAMQKFFSFQPHLPFRFKVEFFFSENDLKIGENFTYFVKSVKLPVMEPGEGEGTIFLGNGILSIPIFNPASREISITFEENDYMDILKLIDLLNETSYRMNYFQQMVIGITEFETDMLTPLRRKAYCVRFKGYEEPQFSNAGGVNLVTASITFKVDSEIGNWDGQEIVLDGNIKKLEGLSTSVSGIEMKDLVSTSFQNENSAGTNTRDFVVTDAEIDAILLKIKTDKGMDIDREVLRTVLETNAAKMKEAYEKLSENLKNLGFSVKINAYNDAGHGIGLGTTSGSHLLGQKIDISLFDKNNKKITFENMTAEQRKLVAQAANNAGLITNYEFHGNKKDSLWGDFALQSAMSIGTDGKLIENQVMHAWVDKDGKQYAYNADTLKRAEFKNK